jgi:hypothetical protein
MDTVLLGVRRSMIRLPWRLFQLGMRREARRTERAFGDLDEVSRRVHHFVVREMPSWRRPMPPQHIASSLGLSEERVTRILDDLERRMIFVYREGGPDVVWAYPVTAAETPHHMAFGSGERIDAA